MVSWIKPSCNILQGRYEASGDTDVEILWQHCLNFCLTTEINACVWIYKFLIYNFFLSETDKSLMYSRIKKSLEKMFDRL